MTLYLSRLILNPRSRSVRLDLADCHQLHRTVLRAFPNLADSAGKARQQVGVLYRVETDSRSGAIQLLVQSQEPPDWSRLPPNYLLLPDALGGISNPACKPFSYDAVVEGMDFAFRLRANPTKRIRRQTNPETGKDWSGKRVNLQREEDLQAWIRRKGEQGGFEILSIQSRTDVDEQERFQRIFGDVPDALDDVPDLRSSAAVTLIGYKGRREDRGRPRLTFGSVIFDGRLRVTDADTFRNTLEQGIGSGKAYGFGLLSIARA